MPEGGCFCGAIRYKAEGTPLSSGICHCRSCRKIASSPTLPYVAFPADAVMFTQGSPVAFRSSPSVTRSFCGRCGSPLTYCNDKEPNLVDVMTCSLDDPEAFPPALHIWVAGKLTWDMIADGLPAYIATKNA
jgi:hypothetical protein